MNYKTFIYYFSLQFINPGNIFFQDFFVDRSTVTSRGRLSLLVTAQLACAASCLHPISSVWSSVFIVTRCFDVMTHSSGPAYRVQEGTPRVTPEIGDDVLRGVALVGVHQPQATADVGVHDGHACPAHMFGIHHLYTHADPERVLHAFCKLGRGKATDADFVFNSVTVN